MNLRSCSGRPLGRLGWRKAEERGARGWGPGRPLAGMNIIAQCDLTVGYIVHLIVQGFGILPSAQARAGWHESYGTRAAAKMVGQKPSL